MSSWPLSESSYENLEIKITLNWTIHQGQSCQIQRKKETTENKKGGKP